MKNLVWALAGLIFVVICVFLFTSGGDSQNDTTIPTPISVATPSPDITSIDLNKVQGEKMNLPFEVLKLEEIQGKTVKFDTSAGVVLVELSTDTPIASSNFISLVNKKFYDGLVFHRVIENFMIQGGDPKGNGTGGPGYSFVDETVKLPYKRGVVAMANSGPNTNGSQFFIMHKDYQLPPNYTIFGKVISGIEVVDKIASSQVDDNDKPVSEVVMQSVTLQ